MIRLALNRAPTTVALRGAFLGATVTLRRLTSNEFAIAHSAARAILRDKSKLVELMEEYDLRPKGRKLKDLLNDIEFMTGLGEWLGAVECGERAISAWTGFTDEAGAPIDPSRKALEVAFLSRPFLDQVVPEIDRAAQLLVLEGKDLGSLPNGSPAPAPTASPPNTATTAGSATSPALPASPAGEAVSARKSNTRRGPKKAQPSGGSSSASASGAEAD